MRNPFIEFAVGRPKWVLILTVLITIGFLAQFPRIQIDTDPENMLPEGEPARSEPELPLVPLPKDRPKPGELEPEVPVLGPKIGARGLRMIMEELMLDMMFQLPSQKDTKEVVVTQEVVLNKSNPLVVMEKAG